MKTSQFIHILIFAFLCNKMLAQGVSQTRHNLSLFNNENTKSIGDANECKFCHVGHSVTPKTPSWDKRKSGSNYILYNSSTLDANPGQPDGTSMLCLSCHDGTVALSSTSKDNKSVSFTKLLTSRGNLGTDLSDDHPISFFYDMKLAIKDNSLKSPIGLPVNFLDEQNKMQCTSCHDPHKDVEGNFLKRTNENSDLCMTCHEKNGYDNGSHLSSLNTWKGIYPNPWAHMDKPYMNVSQNGCSNCHDTHNAKGKIRLLKHQAEEDNCLDCHNGNVAEKNILNDFSKPYRHDVYAYNGTHDPLESNLSKTKHIECADCHNPHASNKKTAEAPFVKGSVIGVRGVDKNGVETPNSIYEYEICFKCHADNSMVNEKTIRYFGNSNVRLDFQSTNISYHPVIEQGKNANPRGLIAPYNANSKVYCSSCHSSDNKNGPAGPHGSIFPRILKANYDMSYTPQLGKNWSSLMINSYALCFECHEPTEVTTIHTNISGGHFMETISCNSCHDPHGFEGGTAQENSYGLNFDRAVIQPNPLNGRFIDVNQKKCFMTCHDPKGVVNYTHKETGSSY